MSEIKEELKLEDIEGFISIKKIERPSYIPYVRKESWGSKIDRFFCSVYTGFTLRVMMFCIIFFYLFKGHDLAKISFTPDQYRAIANITFAILLFIQFSRSEK